MELRWAEVNTSVSGRFLHLLNFWLGCLTKSCEAVRACSSMPQDPVRLVTCIPGRRSVDIGGQWLIDFSRSRD